MILKMFANYISSSYSCYNTIWTQGKCLMEWSICCSSINTGFQIPKTFIRPGKTRQVSVIPVLGRQKQGLLGKDAWVDQLELMSSSFNGILCINKKNVEDNLKDTYCQLQASTVGVCKCKGTWKYVQPYTCEHKHIPHTHIKVMKRHIKSLPSLVWMHFIYPPPNIQQVVKFFACMYIEGKYYTSNYIENLQILINIES